MEFRVRVEGLEFRVRVEGLGFRVEGLGFRELEVILGTRYNKVKCVDPVGLGFVGGPQTLKSGLRGLRLYRS